MKITAPRLLIVSVFLLSSQAYAQTAIVYAYDTIGRVTNAGKDDQSTTYYIYDTVGNRKMVRCCSTIGGWQVKDDGFDPYFYVQTYSDIRLAGIDPYTHWLQHGASENRWPNRFFNTSWYRSTYGIPASVNPLTDYHVSGWQAGRNPSPAFSTTAYHTAYPDTASIDPLSHYLHWGYGEGRLAFAAQ
jgi:hypothetical protein